MLGYALFKLIASVVHLYPQAKANALKQESNLSIFEIARVKQICLVPALQATTFGMLQGTWVSIDDNKFSVRYSGNTEYEFYKKELVDKSIFYLSDTCDTSSMLLTSSKKNGCFLIITDEHSNGATCYSIRKLTSESLVLEYHGKLLRFIKKPIRQKVSKSY